MLSIDFGRLKRRLGLLEHRLDLLKRGEPSVATAVVSHGAETPIRSTGIEAEPAQLAAGFAELEQLAKSMRASQSRSEAIVLAQVGNQLASQEHSTVPLGDLTFLHDTCRRAVELARSVHQHLQMRDSRVELIIEAHRLVLQGKAINKTALDEMIAQLILDSDQIGHAGLDFESSPGGTRNLAQQSLNIAGLIAFLTSRDGKWRGRRANLIAAALLMDAPLIDSLGVSDAVAREHFLEHPRRAAKLLAKVGHFDVELLDAVAVHHAKPETPSKRKAPAKVKSQLADVLAVAAAYVHHRWPRPDRMPGDPRSALRAVLLDAEKGLLDVETTFRLLDISFFPVGTRVELSGGEQVEVVATQKVGSDLTLAAQPIVRVLKDRAGDAITTPLYWNLALMPDKHIVREVALTK